jgi:predicted short-subunit dehydrogenase-like oxidoreductase (DUF2520 family)
MLLEKAIPHQTPRSQSPSSAEAFSLGSQDHRSDFGIRICFDRGIDETLQQLGGQRIPALGSIQSEFENRSVSDFDQWAAHIAYDSRVERSTGVRAMNASAEILIIGPGRLGRCMARWLLEVGRSVRLIGRGESIPRSPLTWLTVPDRSIADVARAVPGGGVLLHASGAVGLDSLQPHPTIGSLHPLMTFTGEERRSQLPPRIPAAISGVEEARRVATELAHALGFEVFDFDGDRRIYHAAAVLSGNFATVLLARAAELLASQGVDESMARQVLAPLAIQSIQNAAQASPEDVLTGPVARRDHQVIQSHLDALRELAPEQEDLYRALLSSATALISPREQADD